MSAMKAVGVSVLLLALFAPLVALAQGLGIHMSGEISDPLREWLYHRNTIAVAVGAAFGGLAEIYMAAKFHQDVAVIEPPKGVIGLAMRALFNAGCVLFIAPPLIEWWFSTFSFSAVMGLSFLSAGSAPQLVGTVFRRFGLISKGTIEQLGPSLVRNDPHTQAEWDELMARVKTTEPKPKQEGQ